MYEDQPDQLADLGLSSSILGLRYRPRAWREHETLAGYHESAYTPGPNVFVGRHGNQSACSRDTARQQARRGGTPFVPRRGHPARAASSTTQVQDGAVPRRGDAHAGITASSSDDRDARLNNVTSACGMSSRLFQEVREEARAPTPSVIEYSSAGWSRCAIGSTTGNIEACEHHRRATRQSARGSVTEEELHRTKGSSRLDDTRFGARVRMTLGRSIITAPNFSGDLGEDRCHGGEDVKRLMVST